MNEELKNKLAEYLGELLYKSENEFYWIEKDRIIEKINAVNVLLGIHGHIDTWCEKTANEIIKIRNGTNPSPSY